MNHVLVDVIISMIISMDDGSPISRIFETAWIHVKSPHKKKQADPIQGLPGINKALTFGRRQRWRGGSDPQQINSASVRRADRSCLKGLLAAVRCMSIPDVHGWSYHLCSLKNDRLKTLPAKHAKRSKVHR